MKAIFLDRDGTIIIDKHYMHKVSDIEYFKDSMAALKIFQDKGYELFVVTNQSGVARGYFKIEAVFEIHSAMQEHLKKLNLKPYLDVAVSAHSADSNSPYRKPGPMMINDLCKKWNIDKKKSYMVGDKLTDALAGENAGVTGVLLRSDKLKIYKSYEFYPTLLDFANSVS